MIDSEHEDLALLGSRIAAAMPALTADDQQLAIALYRQLAEGQPVVPQRLAHQIGVHGGWIDETLERWPGVYRDERGNVIGFWGLAQRPMPPHRFLVDGNELWTWCSWDSLFIPLLLGRGARVESVCATTGEPISAEVTPTGVGAVSPAGAVISFLRPDAEFSHDVIVSFCHHVLFFRSEDAGKAWTATHPNAFLLTVEQGFELGRLVVEAKYGQTLDSLREVAMTAGPELSEVVQRALSAAGIAPARFGPARLERVSESERKLYRWILECFARGCRPEVEQLCDRASELGIEIEETLGAFATLDLVHHDSASGEILVAYPFSAHPRGHSVLIDGTRRVEAMCAIDALGISPMLELPIEITSRDPLSGAEVWVRLDPGDGTWWEPTTAVVLAGSACCDGPSFRGCCDVLNFFESEDTAEQYLNNQPELAGFPISIPGAIEAGRAVFANLLKEP